MHTTSQNVQFAICVKGDKESDLEQWKVYRVLPDRKGSEVGYLRVIDESGEDYLYPQSRFAIVELSKDIQERLLAAVES